MATKQQWRNSCCNPFNKVKHSVRDKSQLRTVTKSICEKFPSILLGDKICDSCRKNLSTVSEIPQVQVEPLDQSISSLDFLETNYSSESTSPSPVKQFQASVTQQSREKANKYLRDVGVTPITKRKLQSRKYQKKKMETITRMLQMSGIDEKTSDDGEIIAQLKDKFRTANRSEKVQILTVLPQSWSICKIQTEFGASNFSEKSQSTCCSKWNFDHSKPQAWSNPSANNSGSCCKFL